MRAFVLASLLPFLSFTVLAQYGSFDASAVKAARATTTIVVLDAGDSPYNRSVMNAVKADWKFTSAYEFVSIADLAAQPISPDRTYLMKIAKTDLVKFDGTFLTLVRGWKPKKGDVLQQKNNAFNSIPVEQELAFMQIDPMAINEGGKAPMLAVYLKHMQNYLGLVEKGSITDKATADRTYSGRTRSIRDMELWLAKDQLDKSIPDATKLKEFYTHPAKTMEAAQLIGAAEKQNSKVAIGDVLLTGDHKNKHCFKRVFNAGTGELLYQNDDAAIFGKKEGFIEEDLKAMERAR